MKCRYLKMSLSVGFLLLAASFYYLVSSFIWNRETECVRRKDVCIISGVGIPSVCEPGMRISTILRRIGRFANYHDSDDYYAKYEWGLDIEVAKKGWGTRVDTLLFRVLPIEWGTLEPFDLHYRPTFSNESALFRGRVDGIIDFSNGKVPIDEIVGKYGDCLVTFRHGEPWESVEGVESYKVVGVNGEVLCLCYQSHGIQFVFRDGLVESIVVFKPL